MSKSRFRNIIFGNCFLGLEVFSENNSEKTTSIIIDRRNNNLNIGKTFEYDNIKDIKDEAFSSIPVILTVYTDKVLIKETELIEKNDSLLVKKSFPTLNIEDFYFDIWRTPEKCIISLARKSYIDEMIIMLQGVNKMKIISVFIGISNVKHIVDYVFEENISLNSKCFNKASFSVKQNIQINYNSYSFKEITMSNTNILAFTSVIEFIQNNTNGSIDKLNDLLRYTVYQHFFLKKYLKSFLFSLLILLVINFLFFNHYFNKFNMSNIENTTKIESQDKREKLKESIIIKQNIVNEISKANSLKVSLILNQIGETVPNTIIFNDLQFQPLLKKGTVEKLPEYSDDIIFIAGISSNNSAFTNWIEQISSLKNIKNVTIVRYEQKDNDTAFEINVYINEIKQ